MRRSGGLEAVVNRVHPLEARTIAKVSARFLPLLIVSYFVAYLDRVNVSFAALTMRADLGLSATAYGFGAGIFFIAYCLFEVPSNLSAGALRGAQMDRTHHVLVGRAVWRDGVCLWAHQLLRCAGAAGYCGGRLLPRHHLLPDAVVPGELPRPDHWLFHGGGANFHGDWGPSFRTAPWTRWPPGHEGMAVAVHHRSGAGVDFVCGGVLLSD